MAKLLLTKEQAGKDAKSVLKIGDYAKDWLSLYAENEYLHKEMIGIGDDIEKIRAKYVPAVEKLEAENERLHAAIDGARGQMETMKKTNAGTTTDWEWYRQGMGDALDILNKHLGEKK
jgi:hypothetical protein